MGSLARVSSPTFERLSQFISSEMRMSHIYQPVMLIELLADGGQATVQDIARAFLAYDRSQLEYYLEVTKRMPGRVLASHGLVERDGDTYRLVGAEGLAEAEVEELVALCRERLDEYVKRRGDRIWAHRGTPVKGISGSARYEVLKAARGRCALCGVEAQERFLEVDHIVPRSRGGTNDVSNLQALCWKCNANKGNRDDTDFRLLDQVEASQVAGCPFCEFDRPIVAENRFGVAVRDAHPVTPLHTLVVPRRHVGSYFELSGPERNLVHDLVATVRAGVLEEDRTVAGFNVGVNDGADAGQTVQHSHVHVIPRRRGDVAVPRGGVRGVIAERQGY